MAIKVYTTIDVIGGVSPIAFSEAVLKKVGSVVRDDTRERVLKQERTDGGRIKENKAATLERKKRAGRPLLSLIDAMRRFVKKVGWVITTTRNSVEVTHVSPVLRYVQEKGYVGWFGLGAAGRAKVRALFVDHIRAAVKRGAKGLR